MELRVAPGSKLDGLELYRLPSVCQAKVLVCAVERGDKIYIPKGDFTLEAEDRLNVVGTAREVYQFFDHVNGPKEKSERYDTGRRQNLPSSEQAAY